MPPENGATSTLAKDNLLLEVAVRGMTRARGLCCISLLSLACDARERHVITFSRVSPGGGYCAAAIVLA